MPGGRFLLQVGKLIVSRSDGTSLFNADDKLFHPVSAVSGVKTFGNMGGGGNGTTSAGPTVDQTNIFNLGTVNPACSQVIGAVRFGLADNNGAPVNRWTMFMGGDVFWVLDGENRYSNTTFGDNIGCLQLVKYSFDISGDQCRMIQRVIFSDTNVFYTVLAHSVEYKLRCGVWV